MEGTSCLKCPKLLVLWTVLQLLYRVQNNSLAKDILRKTVFVRAFYVCMDLDEALAD